MQFHNQSLTLPITAAARKRARQFAHQQQDPHKVEQVYLNTLAIWVMHDYLHLMGIPSDLEAGDSWNPVVRACVDVADLEVSGVGRLECRPIRPNQESCTIPPEVWGDRIGYVVIEIAQDDRRATLLGFAVSAAVPTLYRDRLRSLATLLVYLSEFNLAPSEPPQAGPGGQLNHLDQWLNGIFEAGWQTLETLLSPTTIGMVQFRHCPALHTESPSVQVKRAKLLTLGAQAAPPLMLVVMLSLESQAQRLLRLQVCSLDRQAQLPLDLRLAVFDQTGQFVLEDRWQPGKDYLNVQLSGQPGEQFRILVAAGNQRTTEKFVM